MSIILEKRSIDLYFESEEKLKRWFYGLRYYIIKRNPKIKIKTKFDFLISKLKLRLLKEIRDFDDNSPELKKNKEILILNDMKEYAENDKFQYESLPVIKVILFYVKLMKLNQ
jgi:hypothetical protein